MSFISHNPLSLLLVNPLTSKLKWTAPKFICKWTETRPLRPHTQTKATITRIQLLWHFMHLKLHRCQTWGLEGHCLTCFPTKLLLLLLIDKTHLFQVIRSKWGGVLDTGLQDLELEEVFTFCLKHTSDFDDRFLQRTTILQLALIMWKPIYPRNWQQFVCFHGACMVWSASGPLANPVSHRRQE